MAESDQEAVASAEPASAATPAAADGASAAVRDQPLPVEVPKIEAAIAEVPIGLDSLSAIAVGPARAASAADPAAAAADTADAEVPPPSPDEAIMPPPTVGDRPSLLRRYAPLAAAVVAAIACGGIIGAAATLELTGYGDRAAAVAALSAASVDEARGLKDSVGRLNGEVGKLKASIDSANRAAAAQIARLSERLERAEKAQAEPAAKLAKIAESLERLERKSAAHTASAAASDITGSVPDKPRPAVAEGWTLLDYYAGRAVVENRAGTLFEVGPGSNLPGLGRVESIKREGGRVVVSTSKGTITSALETRAPSRYLPYRY